MNICIHSHGCHHILNNFFTIQKFLSYESSLPSVEVKAQIPGFPCIQQLDITYNNMRLWSWRERRKKSGFRRASIILVLGQIPDREGAVMKMCCAYSLILRGFFFFLRVWLTTTEPARLEPVLRNGRGRNRERPAHRDEEWPPLAATGESPRTETKTQHSQKNKYKLIN